MAHRTRSIERHTYIVGFMLTEMPRRHATISSRMPLPRPSVVRFDEQGSLRAARMRELRQVLAPSYLPPPVVPLRAHLLDTAEGQRVFLELCNFSGCVLEELVLEAVTLDAYRREQDIMCAHLSDLGVAGDPQRVVPVGGFALDPRYKAEGALIRVLYARFSDGSTWQGRLDTLEDPRSPDFERMRASEEFFRPYRDFLRAIEGQDSTLLN